MSFRHPLLESMQEYERTGLVNMNWIEAQFAKCVMCGKEIPKDELYCEDHNEDRTQGEYDEIPIPQEG